MKRFAVLIFFPVLALANGHVIPNGGDVVVCPASAATSEIFAADGKALLDIFEIKSSYRYTYRRLAKYRALDLETAFPRAVDEFFSRAPDVQEMLLGHFADRASELRFVAGLKRGAEWSLNAALQGCETRAIATQYNRTSAYPGAPLVIEINRDLWGRAPTDLKLALLFHEYIFGQQLNAGGDCAHTRVSLLVGTVLADNAIEMSLNEWLAVWNPQCGAGGDPQAH